jgi:hypothetical protein
MWDAKHAPAAALIVGSLIIAGGCGGPDEVVDEATDETTTSADQNAGGTPVLTYEMDSDLLTKHTDAIELVSDEGAAIVVVPEYQGRVMTSRFANDDGAGNGWVNHDLISSGKIEPHINVFGGEDRFWLGPEGGQYAIFFAKGAEFGLEDWQTPAFIDTEGYNLDSSSTSEAVFSHSAQFKNMSDTEFNVGIKRTVRIKSASQVGEELGVEIGDDVEVLAYESENTLTNTGDAHWTADKGLLSIWILGMLKHSETTNVIVPYKEGPESEMGAIVNDTYFGKVPANRLVDNGGYLVFKGDGQMRSKIGVNATRALPMLGSYDPGKGLLTIVTYTKPDDATQYVNSMWEHQEEPYAGDVVNSYNDGPPDEDTPPLGPFYELETSSPALALGAGVSYTHFHRTFHLRGSQEDLTPIAQAVLGVDLAEVAATFE